VDGLYEGVTRWLAVAEAVEPNFRALNCGVWLPKEVSNDRLERLGGARMATGSPQTSGGSDKAVARGREGAENRVAMYGEARSRRIASGAASAASEMHNSQQQGYGGPSPAGSPAGPFLAGSAGGGGGGGSQEVVEGDEDGA
jgi:hypothetical protein